MKVYIVKIYLLYQCTLVAQHWKAGKRMDGGSSRFRAEIDRDRIFLDQASNLDLGVADTNAWTPQFLVESRNFLKD